MADSARGLLFRIIRSLTDDPDVLRAVAETERRDPPDMSWGAERLSRPTPEATVNNSERHPLVWETQTQVVRVVLKLTEREANDLYSDIYRLDRDVSGAACDYPLIHSVYDALYQAGVDGTR